MLDKYNFYNTTRGANHQVEELYLSYYHSCDAWCCFSILSSVVSICGIIFIFHLVARNQININTSISKLGIANIA